MRRRVVVLGMMGAYPFGGQSWLYVNWLRGLLALGHEVWYVEDNDLWQYDPDLNSMTDRCSYAVAHVERMLRPIAMQDRWALRWTGPPERRWGPAAPCLEELYASCDVLLNICGATRLHDAQLDAPLRVLVETDPVIEEARMAGGDERVVEHFRAHDVVASYAEAYGTPECRVPRPPNPLILTRQPVDLELWPLAWRPDARYFSTIANYRVAVHDVVLDGVTYRWSKHGQWERFIDLPARTEQELRVALSIEPEDQRRLEDHGWEVVPARTMSLDVYGSYRSFIQESRAEFSVAKDPNVELRSGWFSERDACYLASGKPVVAQDTGFGAALPTGEGLLAVSSVEEAADSIERVNREYPRHCEAARRVAETHFEARGVAGRLLSDLGLS